MHRLTNLAALHNQGGLYTLAHANQIVVNSAYSQQRRDCCVLLVDVTIGEDDVVHTLVDAGFCLVTEFVECFAQAFLTLLDFKEDGQFLRVETFIPYIT